MQFTATCPRGLEDLLRRELVACGAEGIVETRAALTFSGELETALRVCLWSRIANRVLLPLASFPAFDADDLYAGAADVDWPEHFGVDSTFIIDVTLSGGVELHSRYVAQRTKDAVCDRFRDACGRRPNIESQRPDIRLNLYVGKDEATISLDLGGRSLHQRGYRRAQVEAPLKENVAAALLMRMGWPETEGPFVDPMCGGGSLLIEAALMAGDVAPGLFADHWGFSAWNAHKPAVWQHLLDEAHAWEEQGLAKMPVIIGGDLSQTALQAARQNRDSAGLRNVIELRYGDAAEWAAPAETGLLLTNPPYGERLQNLTSLTPEYLALGQMLQTKFVGWRVGLLTSEESLARATELRANKHWQIDNGPLVCRLYRFDLKERAAKIQAPEALVNRLNKNRKHLGRWARREAVDCFRVYDADLPEYASAIDLYQTNAELIAHVQEYAPPQDIPQQKAQRRLRETLSAVQQVFELPPKQIRVKTRSRQRGDEQYTRLSEDGELHIVNEGGLKFAVNFDDYLDTGLFLDHRPVRMRLQQEARGKHFLNLFCYTSTATVHAASGGAKTTTSVDLSNTYLEWSVRNFALNSIAGTKHHLERADVIRWLDSAAKKDRRYDLIFCDPPSFSNSKKMMDSLDIQRDHRELIELCMAVLADGGLLLFSCNRRGFKLDPEIINQFDCKDITRETIPEDFRRTAPPHKAWEIRSAG